MIIELTPIERLIIEHTAKARYKINRVNGVKDAKVGPQDNIKTDLDGFGGEYAFCKHFNLYPDLVVQVTSQKTDEGDCFIGDKSIDVKTTKYKNGKLICAMWKNDAIDYYALMVGEFPNFEFKGFAKASDLKQDQNIMNLGRGSVYALEQSKLTPNLS